VNRAFPLERDEEKWKPVFARSPLYTFGIDRFHDFGSIRSHRGLVPRAHRVRGEIFEGVKSDGLGSALNQRSSEVEYMSTTSGEGVYASPLIVFGNALGSAGETIYDAASDASASAKSAAAKVRSTFRAGVYNAAYGISFGVVFSAVFLTELLDENNALRRGLADGAKDAFKAVADRRAHPALSVDAGHEEGLVGEARHDDELGYQ
jgi:hypothetical protein